MYHLIVSLKGRIGFRLHTANKTYTYTIGKFNERLKVKLLNLLYITKREHYKYKLIGYTINISYLRLEYLFSITMEREVKHV